ncbi:MAG: GntR family transcriptional regulator [Chloroflexi bacterium]|nr:GntR family transcriptional regulator [Chloroflexota bacterium]
MRTPDTNELDTTTRREPREPDLATRAYDGIREAILTMSFQPGQQLQEVALAHWLGTSRTPVREAIRRLQSEGLVESSSSRGVVVAQVSIDDVENAYLVIEVLEGLAGRLAAERLTDEGAIGLRRVLDELQHAAAAADLERWTQLDAELHDTIRAIAANPKLNQVANLVYPVIERVRSIYLREGHEPDQVAIATADHCVIGEAILARDATRAEALSRQLFAKAGADNVRLLKRWVSPLRRSF